MFALFEINTIGYKLMWIYREKMLFTASDLAGFCAAIIVGGCVYFYIVFKRILRYGNEFDCPN